MPARRWLDAILDSPYEGCAGDLSAQEGMTTMTYLADRPFTLYFVRHGITEPNFRGFRCGGDLDLPMMDIGCDQAYLLAKQIEKMNLRVGVIVAGSLIRTRQTASIISGVLGTVPIEIEPLFNERKLGQWNNRPIAETEERAAERASRRPAANRKSSSSRASRSRFDHLRPMLEQPPARREQQGRGTRAATICSAAPSA